MGELFVPPCHDPFKLAPQMRGLSTRSSCRAEGLACLNFLFMCRHLSLTVGVGFVDFMTRMMLKTQKY